MCLQHCSWGQLLKGKILLQDKKGQQKNTRLRYQGSKFLILQLPITPNRLYSRSSAGGEGQLPSLWCPEVSGKTFWCPGTAVSGKGSALFEMEEGLCSQDPREC